MRPLTFLILWAAPLVAQTAPVRVSADSPFAADCTAHQSGVNYRNGVVEPWVAVDPNDANHLIGVWQQDRWSNGGASGLVSGVSTDGGQTWSTSFAHFSRCSGGTADNGGNYDRNSDPWVTIAPDGTAYQISLSFNASNANKGVFVSRSADGGLSWSNPAALIQDTISDVNDDKPSITADPFDPNLVYAVWDRMTGLNSTDPFDYRGPAWISRTTDGGRSWEAARILYDPGPNAQTIGHQIVVLPDGTLVDLFTLVENASPSGSNEPMFEAVTRSTDQGVTWSDPVIMAQNQGISVINAKTKTGVRIGAEMASIAVDPDSGALYVTWHDARFSRGARDGIAFSQSTDGGLAWSAPVQVNQAPGVAAFTAAVAVGTGGAIGITYFDFRNDTSAPATLLTNCWLIVSQDGGVSWQEIPIAGPFDLLAAPRHGARPFLGDYHGLLPYNDTFLAFFVAANSGNVQNPSDVFTVVADPAQLNIAP